ncbi:50S ribosomal protein L19e [Candidatus Pacearchaeota archaeon]|nr:50S ribosomal protein L19e [Candidatus Pacearchaeota archaeon]
MDLGKKKKLAAKILGVGKRRIIFDFSRLDEIKEAITRQDIQDLVKDKAIKIRPVKGKHHEKREKRKRGPGKIKMKIKERKRKYIVRIRMLRRYIASLLKQKKISKERYKKFRMMAKMGEIRDKKSLNELL